MTLQLVEGQEFGADFLLVSRLSRGEGTEGWIALDRSSGERILLKIRADRLSPATQATIDQTIAATRGLIHPNIARIFGRGEHEGHPYLVTQLVRNARPFDVTEGTPRSHWPVVEQLLAAIEFAHSLGLAHGHLHPHNILIDDQDQVMLTDFGLPPTLGEDNANSIYLSDQIRAGDAADPSDDIYSLGRIITALMTRSPLSSSGAAPMPEPLGTLVQQMLSDRAYDRPVDISAITATLRDTILGESDASLTPANHFTRSTATQPRTVPVTPVETPGGGRSVSTPTALAGLAGLIVTALVVFSLLPNDTTEVEPPPVTTTASTSVETPDATPTIITPALTPLEQARQEQLEQRGKDLAKEILRLQVTLEDIGVHRWGGDKYAESEALTEQADEAYRSGEFEAGLALYEAAITVLETTIASVDSRKQSYIETGEAAVADGDHETAIAAYQIVTAMEPTNAEHRDRLELAMQLESLRDLLEKATFLEQEGQLDEAKQAATDALALRSDWQPAIAAQARITAAIDQRRFSDAMSAGFAALSSQQYDEARQSFEQARQIQPSSDAPDDGLQQVDLAITQGEIDQLTGKARIAETDENWADAIAHYQDIQALDATLVLAREGEQQAAQNLALNQSVDRLVNRPTLLANDEELQNARRLVATAVSDNPGPILSNKIDRLSQFIALARIPVEVRLRSDNRTDVTIYRYGELGRIQETSVTLTPGQYTIVGKRPGYKNVQYELTLIGGREIEPIYISCTERI